MKTQSPLKLALCAAGFSAFALMGGAQAQVILNQQFTTDFSGATTTADLPSAYPSPPYFLANMDTGATASVSGGRLTISDPTAPNTGRLGYSPVSFTGGFVISADMALVEPAGPDNANAMGFEVGGLDVGFYENVDGTAHIFDPTLGFESPTGIALPSPGVLLHYSLQSDGAGNFIETLSNGTTTFTHDFTRLTQTSATITSIELADFGGNASGQSAVFANWQVSEVAAPEPSSMGMLGLGALGLVFLVVRRRHCLI